jgi:hypothetical protein
MNMKVSQRYSGGQSMNLAEKILENVKMLSEDKQREVLDFAEYLRARTEQQEKEEWSEFSLRSAMSGIEEDSIYDLDDLKERFS